MVGAGSRQEDDILSDLGQAARTGDRAVDLEVRATKTRVVRVVRVGLVELTLVVKAGKIPAAVATRCVGLSEIGIRGEIERDAGAELLDDRHLIPITGHVTHDRTTAERDRLPAGLTTHHLEVDARRQDIVTGPGAIDGPTFEGAGLLDEDRRGRPARRRDLKGPALLDRGGDRRGAEGAGVRDAESAFADGEGARPGEARADVTEGQDAVPDLVEVIKSLVVQAADGGAAAELHADGRSRTVRSGVDVDLVMVMERDHSGTGGRPRAVDLEGEATGLADARDGVGRPQLERGDLLEPVVGEDDADLVEVVGGDGPSVPDEEVRRPAVIAIPELRHGVGVVAVVHAASHQGDRPRPLGTRREELQAAAVNDPRTGELLLVGADIQERRSRLGDLRGVDRAVELSGHAFGEDQGFSRAARTEVKIGVDGRVAIRAASVGEYQAAAADGNLAEGVVRAAIDGRVNLTGDAQGMNVEIRAQGDGPGGLEAQNPGAVIEIGQRGRIDGGRRADDIIRGVGRGERLESERGVIPEELTADTAQDPRSHHAVSHQ